ncbi:MAG: hypothetical protein JWP12_1243 [Bacteroidetes bacterium]|nr:hypothetical protein [Bacteroidota bacterium]
MKKTLILALALFAGVAGFAQAKKKSPIDGRIYSMTLTPQGEKKAEPTKDEASLATNKFKSTFLLQAGFQPTDYEYEIDSTSGTPVIHFTVEAKNENQERFSWDATVDGDAITGTAIIRRKGKIEHTYAITGTWKNKKKPKPQAKPAPKAAAADSTKTN